MILCINMANISTFFSLIKYWNRAALIIASCKSFFLIYLLLIMEYSIVSDITYLSSSFLSKKAFLLTYWYFCALGSTCTNNLGNSFAQDWFFGKFSLLDFFFRAILLLDLVTLEFVWRRTQSASIFKETSWKDEFLYKSKKFFSDFHASNVFSLLINFFFLKKRASTDFSTSFLSFHASVIFCLFLTVECWQWPSQKMILLQLILIIRLCFCIHSLPKIRGC